MADPRATAQIRVEIDQATAAINQFQQQLFTVTTTAGQLDKAIVSSQNQFSQMAKTSGSANSALISVGRTIQDMPFGPGAVANNIQFTIEQIGFLARETGSLRGAMAILARTMFGPAGIVIGLGAIVTLWQVFSTRTSEATKEVNKFQEALDKVLGLKIGPESIFDRDFLTEVLSRASDEAENLRATERELTGQIILAKAERDADLQVIVAQREAVRQQLADMELLVERSKERLGFSEQGANAERALNQILDSELRTLQLQAIARQAQKIRANELFDASQEHLRAEEDIFLSLENQLFADAEKIELGKAEFLIRKEILNIRKQEAEAARLESIQLDPLGGELEGLGGKVSTVTREFTALNAAIVNAFSSFGEGIGGAGDPFAEIEGILGDFAVSFGRLMIAAGISIKALQSLNPVAAIAGGLALIAIGGALKRSAESIGAPATAPEGGGSRGVPFNASGRGSLPISGSVAQAPASPPSPGVPVLTARVEGRELVFLVDQTESELASVRGGFGG